MVFFSLAFAQIFSNQLLCFPPAAAREHCLADAWSEAGGERPPSSHHGRHVASGIPLGVGSVRQQGASQRRFRA